MADPSPRWPALSDGIGPEKLHPPGGGERLSGPRDSASLARVTEGNRSLVLAATGLAAGFASSFLGIGGGLIVVPVLMALLDFPIKRAVGTSLATIVFVSAVGVVTESVVKWSNIHWGLALVLTAGSLAGSWLGGKALRRLPEGPLRACYTVFLALAAWRMFASAGTGDGAGLLTASGAPAAAAALSVAAGVLAGISSVLFGIGGGIVIVPALSLIFADFTFHAARATSLVTIIPASAFGAWQHRAMGTVDPGAARRLVPFGLAGAVLGVLSVNRLPARPCRLAFATFLILAAVRLALRLGDGDRHRF